jgi:WD40 repeat protein
VVRSQGSPVTSLAVLPDGRLTSAGRDVRLWPKDGMGDPVVLAHGGPVWSLAVLADGRRASGGSDRNIKLWLPPSSGKLLRTCFPIGADRETGSHMTRWWREVDSNRRSRATGPIFQRPPHGTSS